MRLIRNIRVMDVINSPANEEEIDSFVTEFVVNRLYGIYDSISISEVWAYAKDKECFAKWLDEAGYVSRRESVLISMVRQAIKKNPIVLMEIKDVIREME